METGMFYKRVYSPEGEPFDVPTARANDLILQDGWTQQKPETEKTVSKAKKTRSRKKTQPVVEEVIETVEEPVEAEEKEFFFGDEPAADR
jgi:hypothetical protein